MTTEGFRNGIYDEDLCMHPSIGSAGYDQVNGEKAFARKEVAAAPKPFNLNPKSVTVSARQNDIKIAVKDRHGGLKVLRYHQS